MREMKDIFLTVFPAKAGISATKASAFAGEAEKYKREDAKTRRFSVILNEVKDLYGLMVKKIRVIASDQRERGDPSLIITPSKEWIASSASPSRNDENKIIVILSNAKDLWVYVQNKILRFAQNDKYSLRSVEMTLKTISMTLLLLLTLNMGAWAQTTTPAPSPSPGGGTTGNVPGATAGCIDRSKFQQELNGNQALVDSFCGLMMVEVGSMPATCKTQFFESVMNRAYARGKTIDFEINQNINYWGLKGARKPFDKAECDNLLRGALNGSNENNFNSDNSSNAPGNTVAANKIAKGTAGPRYQFCNGTNSEMFSTDPWAEPKMQELIAKAPGAQCTRFGGNLPSTGQPPNVNDDGSTTQPNPNPDNDPKTGGPDPVQIHFDNLAEMLKKIWVAAFQLMTEQLAANMMAQIQMVGQMFDAKEQLEAQRDIQTLTAAAHKDYHPSEQMCEIGTFVRDLADSQTRAKLTKTTISNRLLARELATGKVLTTEGPKSDFESRIKSVRDNYCNVEDNGEGLDNFCNKKDAPPEWKNRDINFVATVETPLTLNVNFLDDVKTKEEEAVLSLINYLFMHEPPPKIATSYQKDKAFEQVYSELRSVVAMRGIARNSVSNIIAQKAAGPSEDGKAGPFIMALLKQMGLAEDEIRKLVGENPSYFAQMEILTKTIYQDPTFIANLYDKPTNVKRIRAAMQAIKLMQDRDIHEALLRRELLLSMILEVRLRQYQEQLVNRVNGMLFGG